MTDNKIDTAPRSWDLPPEPGPEVRAVRDADGDTWTRESGVWVCHAAMRSWGGLLKAFGPVIDATADVAPPAGAEAVTP